MAAAIGAADGLRKGLVRWRAALLMATLGAGFATLGVHAAHLLPQRILTTLFAFAMLAASTRLLLQERGNAADGTDDGTGQGLLGKTCLLDPHTGQLSWTPHCAATLSGIGAASGLLTGLLGVGGGFLIVPAFKQWTNIRIHGIVATSLFVVALVSIGATASALQAGTRITQIGMLFIASTMTGMVGGRIAAPRLPGRAIQIAFAVLSASVSLLLLWRTWMGRFD
jgi:uncharacterized membrane protein YfcA